MKNPKKPKIFIKIGEGIVWQVISDIKIDLEIIDLDTEDLEEEELIEFTTLSEKKEQGYLYKKWEYNNIDEKLIHDPEYTNKLSKEINGSKIKAKETAIEKLEKEISEIQNDMKAKKATIERLKKQIPNKKN